MKAGGAPGARRAIDIHEGAAIDEAALRTAAAQMLSARPTLTLAGRAGRGNPETLLERAMAG
mgnify:CR=1 FL=1